jgi:hypothetical protein
MLHLKGIYLSFPPINSAQAWSRREGYFSYLKIGPINLAGPWNGKPLSRGSIVHIWQGECKMWLVRFGDELWESIAQMPGWSKAHTMAQNLLAIKKIKRSMISLHNGITTMGKLSQPITHSFSPVTDGWSYSYYFGIGVKLKLALPVFIKDLYSQVIDNATICQCT